jgi:hypothetical protein
MTQDRICVRGFYVQKRTKDQLSHNDDKKKEMFGVRQ